MASQYRRRSLMLNTIAKVAQGNPTIITDSSSRRLKRLDIFGQSAQASTTGAQLLSLDMITNKLPYSVNGITFSDNGDGGIKVTGTATGVATLYFNDMINNLEDGETYSYNSDTELGTLAVSYNDGTPTDYIKTITVNKSRMISIKPYAQYTSGNTVNKVIYPMLNIGNSVKPFELYTGGKPSPIPDYPQEIKNDEISKITICNENLLSLDIDAYATSEGVYVYRNLGFTLQKGIKYVLSVKEIVTGLYAIPFGSTSSDNSPFKEYNSDTVVFTPTETGKYYFHAYNQNGITDEQKILWLNVGEKKPYVEHIEEKVTFSSPITLRGIPVASGGNVTIDGQQYISDCIKEKDGVIGVERNIVSGFTIDGSDDESWNILGNALENTIRFVYKIKALSQYNGISEQLKFETNYNLNTEHFYFDGVNLIIFINKNRLSTQDTTGLKAWLQTNPLTFNYASVTPTFEPLPENIQAQYKALKSYYPNTLIQTGCWNEVTYSAKRGG